MNLVKANDKNVIAYTMIEIPDGNYIHSDIVQFLNQTINSRFMVSKNNNSPAEYAELINFKIDINQGGSGSGKTIVSSTTYAFKHPYVVKQDGIITPFESGNTIKNSLNNATIRGNDRCN